MHALSDCICDLSETRIASADCVKQTLIVYLEFFIKGGLKGGLKGFDPLHHPPPLRVVKGGLKGGLLKGGWARPPYPGLEPRLEPRFEPRLEPRLESRLEPRLEVIIKSHAPFIMS